MISQVQRNPRIEKSMVVQVIRHLTDREVRPDPNEDGKVVIRASCGPDASAIVAQQGIRSGVRQDGKDWAVVVDTDVSAPTVTEGHWTASLRFPAAQFIPGGIRRISLLSEPATYVAILPSLIFWAAPRSEICVSLVDAAVETSDWFLSEAAGDCRETDATRSLMLASNQARDSMVLIDAYAERMRLCIRVGERVRITLEAVNLDHLVEAGGAFHVDAQLEGSAVLMKNRDGVADLDLA